MIQPALTDDLWSGPFVHEMTKGWSAHDNAVNIAVHNAALPDDDKRKITRESVDKLRDFCAQGYCGGLWDDDMNAFADALESYLPPRVPIDSEPVT